MEVLNKISTRSKIKFDLLVALACCLKKKLRVYNSERLEIRCYNFFFCVYNFKIGYDACYFLDIFTFFSIYQLFDIVRADHKRYTVLFLGILTTDEGLKYPNNFFC